MRKWLKELMLECLKETIKQQPLIMASRPPTVDDIYEVGTVWRNGTESYVAKKINVDWVRIQESR